MRTTIRLNDDLLYRARQRAVAEHTSFTGIVEKALRSWLKRFHHGPVRPDKISLPASGRGGIQHGIDLDDTSSLADRMDGIA